MRCNTRRAPHALTCPSPPCLPPPLPPHPTPPIRLAANPTYFVLYGDDYRVQVYLAQNPGGVPRININGLTYIDPIVSGVLA